MFSAPVVLNALTTRAPRASRAISSAPDVDVPTLSPTRPGASGLVASTRILPRQSGIDRAMPLAATRTDYHPTAKFDREHYWVNTGPALTTDYGSPAWERRSRFRRD